MRGNRSVDTLPEGELAEARANARALAAIVEALGLARTVEGAVEAALATVRQNFGWAYGSYWHIEPEERRLVFGQESGDAGQEFRRVTEEASFAEGVGLSGRAWKSRELVFVQDLGQLDDCVRAPAAQRAGVRSGIAFPIFVAGQVAGTMDFFATETLSPSEERLACLRAAGTLVSQAIDRLETGRAQERAAQDIAAVSTMLREVSSAPTAEAALSAALDVIRDGFGWDYGSYWKISDADGELHFAQESGNVGAEFRDVTQKASFAEGVGLSGRAWRARDLVFVPDLAEVTDCVRAPAARRAGVKAGVCLPIVVTGRVVGTLDFFVMRSMGLTEGRASALRNVAALLGQALERFDVVGRLTSAASELVLSIEEVERNVQAATSVARQGSQLAANANRDVAALGAASVEIGQVVKVIQSIAAQTNLLALNATIEAARAGDAGRGFAVVANEVKQLAVETATATATVTDKIATIQAQVDQVISALGEIDTMVERINQTQETIGGVLAQQVGVTKAILG